MEKKKFWTLRYALINITYFAGFCTIHAYAAVYLLAQGFTNTQVGIVLAIANVLSAVAQPLVAGLIDKSEKLTNRIVTIMSAGFILLGSVLLLVFDGNKAAIFIIYALIYMVQFLYQPIITALYFEYAKSGANIMYGLARGLGSAGFAIVSGIIGGIVEANGVTVLVIGNIIIMVLSIILVYTFKKPDGEVPADADGSSSEGSDVAGSEGKAHNNLLEFASVYPKYVLFLVGVVCFFFAHNMINDYLIQIIRNVGGSETQLGYATFIAAFLELPVMASINILLKKFDASKLLMFSGVSFLVKTVILIFATNMVAVYISQACQMFAYAVFIPAAAYYVNETMDLYDQVKGQAFITSAITLGGVFSSLVCGKVLDLFDVRTMLLIGSAVCVVGVIIAVIAMKKSKANA